MAFFNHLLEIDARRSMKVSLDEKDDYTHSHFSAFWHIRRIPGSFASIGVLALQSWR
jgi:hypothetical protein